MSAELMVLPKVWGCAEAAETMRPALYVAGTRKGPVRVEGAPGLKPQVGPRLVHGAKAPCFHPKSPDALAAAARLVHGAEAPCFHPRSQGALPATAPGGRLGGRLHLVRASAAVAAASVVADQTMYADGPIALRRQAVEVQGVGYAFYRKYTEAMLRRYMTMSFENGRVPSLLGRELFRGQASSFEVHSFEDVSNFVHDIGRCLQTLDAGQRHLVRRIALEEYTMEETAAMLGMSLRTVVRRYREAIDRMTRVLLERKLMAPLERAEVEGF